MQNLKALLEEELQHLEKIIEKTESCLKDVPEGRINISECHNIPQFFHYQMGCKNSKGTYINKENEELISALVQKSYNTAVLKKARIRAKKIKNLIKDYDKGEFESIYLNQHPERQKRIEPIEKPWSIYVDEWESQSYRGKDFSDTTKYILTDKGEKVRSKSEKIIADYLFRKGIAYKYECPLYLKGMGTIYPDFTLLSPATRKEIYWEHCGLMDNYNYAFSAIKRINIYQKNHIFPGDRLILTFETDKIVLESEIIQKIVDKYLE